MRPTALVTGAARRVGRAIALELASKGFDVCVHYRGSRAEAQDVVEAARALGSDAWSAQADLGTREGVVSLVRAVQARWPALNVLVNNASAFSPMRFEDIDDDALQAMLQINLLAPMALSRDLLPQLRAADGARVGAPDGQHGVVIHLCDIGAERPVVGYAHYSVSKAGLVMLVKAMAVELAPAVRTVGISPGQVAWPEDYDESLRETLRRRIPMNRAGTPEDVARLCLHVAVEGHYLNGVVIPVDGGLACRY